MRERLVGTVMLVAGVALSYLSVYQPLEAAAREDPTVSFSMKGAVLCPLAVVMGAAYLILGNRATTVFGTRETPKPAVWVCAVVLALAGFGLYFWLRAALEAKGYQF
jgi:hypothetical protein